MRLRLPAAGEVGYSKDGWFVGSICSTDDGWPSPRRHYTQACMVVPYILLAAGRLPDM